MDSTNNDISQSLLESSESIYSTNNTGFFDSLKSINMTTWLLIILILAFLGFNIFAYLAKGTQNITTVFAPLLEKLFGSATSLAGQAIDVSAEGAKAVVGGTAGAVTAGLTAVQNITPNVTPSGVKGQPINEEDVDVMQQSTLNKALNASQQSQEYSQDYQANEATSSIHNSAGKAGWCYVGNDRGFRTCAEVGVNDTCMSGDIFPTQEICMNPNLRV